jgi:hypothetical protein
MNGFIVSIHGVWADCSDGGGANVHPPAVKGPDVNVIESFRSSVRAVIRSLAAA